MVDGIIDFSRIAAMRSLLPDDRAIAAAERLTTPMGRALADDMVARLRRGQAATPPAFKMALQNIERGGLAAYGLPLFGA